MLVYNEETRTFWFNGHSIETEVEFQLMGQMLGLAIYNGAQLSVRFPLVVYKKLLVIAVGFEVRICLCGGPTALAHTPLLCIWSRPG